MGKERERAERARAERALWIALGRPRGRCGSRGDGRAGAWKRVGTGRASVWKRAGEGRAGIDERAETKPAWEPRRLVTRITHSALPGRARPNLLPNSPRRASSHPPACLSRAPTRLLPPSNVQTTNEVFTSKAMVQRPAPAFEANAVENGEFTTVRLADYLGQPSARTPRSPTFY